MKHGLLAFVALAVVPWAGEVPAQSLPPTVEPGVQRDRLLDRDALPPLSGPALLQPLVCGRDRPVSFKSFTLKGVRFESPVVTEEIDPKARWQPYLGQEVTLERVCEIALSLADDYSREAGRDIAAVLPAQYIDGGVVQVMLRMD